MTTIYKLAYLPFLIPFIKKSIRHQQQFMQATVLQDLATLKKHAVSNLSIEDVNKITSYYGNAVAAIMGEGFCILRSRKMSANERNTLTYLGALTGILTTFLTC